MAVCDAIMVCVAVNCWSYGHIDYPTPLINAFRVLAIMDMKMDITFDRVVLDG